MSDREMNTAAHTLEEASASTGYADTSVAWGAKLVQPKLLTEGSVQVAIVDVSGPIVLDCPVELKVSGTWTAASWEGEASQHRRCLAFIGRGLRPGRYVVVVRPTHGKERPLLSAGSLRVTEVR